MSQPFTMIVKIILIAMMALSAIATDTKSACSADTPSDILLIVDTSPSIDNILKDLVSAVAKFSSSLSKDTNFALVTFGGAPVIRSDFTSDKALFNTTLNGLKANGFIRRAAFEAIRMALGPNSGKDMSCVKLNSKKQPVVVKAGCKLSWRKNARKFLVLVTNSDSDLPTDRKFQTTDDQDKNTLCPGFYSQPQLDACMWPNLNIKAQFMPYTFMKAKNGNYQVYRNDTLEQFKLADSFEEEIELTSDIVLESNCSVYSLISTTMGTSDGIADYPISVFNEKSDYVLQNGVPLKQQDGITTASYQFGSPFVAHQRNNLSSFDADLTLKNLKSSGCGNSLQAKVLEGGGAMRNFDIDRVYVKDYGIQYLENILNEVKEHIRSSNSSRRTTSPKQTTTIVSTTETSETQSTSSTSTDLFTITSTSTVQDIKTTSEIPLETTTTIETHTESTTTAVQTTEIVITDSTSFNSASSISSEMMSETVAEISSVITTSTGSDQTTVTTFEPHLEPSTTPSHSTDSTLLDISTEVVEVTSNEVTMTSSQNTAADISSVFLTSTGSEQTAVTTFETHSEPSTTAHYSTEILITDSTIISSEYLETRETVSETVAVLTSVISTSTNYDHTILSTLDDLSTITTSDNTLAPSTDSTLNDITTGAVSTSAQEANSTAPSTDTIAETTEGFTPTASTAVTTKSEHGEPTLTIPSIETTSGNTFTKGFNTVITNITTTATSYSLTIRKITTFTQEAFETPETTENKNTRSSLSSMEIAQFTVFGVIAVCAFSIIAWVARRILK